MCSIDVEEKLLESFGVDQAGEVVDLVNTYLSWGGDGGPLLWGR